MGEIKIVYEDDSILVADKPAGMLVVPTPKNERHTLTNLLNEVLAKRGSVIKAYPCHRIDRDTSGLVLYAKSKAIEQQIIEKFKRKEIRKSYLAFVQGYLNRNQGTIDIKIEGKPAITKYKVLERKRSGFSVVDIETITGRTNQIRIHFKQIGNPLVGDRKFAFGKDYRLKFRRTALHARRLEFTHPVSGKAMSFSAELPEDMNKFLMMHRK